MVVDLFEAKINLNGTAIPQSDSSVFPTVDRADLHQQQMFEALRNQNGEAVLNTNPTGAGKTLSWAAPTIRSGEWGDGWRVLATYPTKALVDDQYKTLLALFEDYYSSGVCEFYLDSRKDGEKIITNGQDEYLLANRVIKATSDTVENTTTEVERAKVASADPSFSGIPTIVLTTPDTLTLISAGLPFDSDVGSSLIDFDKIVVDEFHLVNPRAKRLLPFHLDVNLNMPSHPYLNQLVFLSATPIPDYIGRIENAFDTVTVANKRYKHSDPSRRTILPDTDLYVTSRDMFSNGEWIADNIGEITDFYDPSGQMLIVLDSVREVDEVYTALSDETDLAVGRIYGWKTTGRSETIEEADIIVGNTAVEVGIDFDNLNRIISTAYDPASAIQRLGRMRHRDAIEGYKIALITKSSVQSQVVKQGQGGLGRTQLEEIFISELGESTNIPYYELLCAAYAQYLWTDSEEYPGDSSLSEKYTGYGDLSADERYVRIAYKHFAEGTENSLREKLTEDDFWQSVEKLRRQCYRDGDGEYPVFKEMHTYRPSSLSCLILDLSDSEQPVKTYQLHHVLKYCEGRFLKNKDEFKSECLNREILTESEERVIDKHSKYVCSYFVNTAKSYNSSRYFKILDYSWSTSKEGLWTYPGEVEHIWAPKIDVDPPIEGTEHIQIGDGDKKQNILARYVDLSREDAIEEYHLGPYANATQIGSNSSILFWQDAILAEAHIAYEFFEGLDES